MALGEQFESVLEAARAGAAWALGALYTDLHPRVLRYLWANEPAEGEDLASEVWIDVASGLARFKGREHDFHRWVFTIARRRMIDLRRRRGRRRTDPAATEVLEAHSAFGNVESEAMTNLATATALGRLAVLSRDQAEVLLLRILGGLSVKEVAAIMGKRPGTVKVLQHRALAKLATELVPEDVTE
jgi:RNA polymerase sigma-70 factor (ECF subfamily)